MSKRETKKRPGVFKTIFGFLGKKKYPYLFSFVLQFFGIFFSSISTFLLKILIDLLSYGSAIEYYAEVRDPISLFITNLLGGYEVLSGNIWMIAIFLPILILIGGTFFVIRRLIVNTVVTMFSKGAWLALFNNIQRAPYTFTRSYKNGDLIQTCTRDEETVRRFITDITSFTYTFFVVTINFTILATLSWIIALCSICLMPFLFGYSYMIFLEIRKRYRIEDDSEGMLTTKMEENLASIRLVKAYNNENFEINDFETYLSDYREKFTKTAFVHTFFFGSSDILVFGQIILGAAVSIFLAVNGDVSAGTIVIAISYVNSIVWPIRNLGTTLTNIAKVYASLDRMYLILDANTEDVDSGINEGIVGDIEFRNVTFTFADTTIPTLDNLSFHIKKGETVAILGKTGAGKSTLAYLLTRLYDVTSGEILVDGKNINEYSKHYLRRNIAVSLQEPFLFSRSIDSNIRIVDPSVEKQSVTDAARIAHIHDSIVNLQNGYDTQVGEKGASLSGGQRQRVAIARTIINKAPILIFDDSLSAVDTQTDIEIRSSLKSRMKDTTTFIITHRIATAKDADVVIVLDNAKIAQIGKFDDLIKEDGLLQRITAIQTKLD